jgi:hypothetical protein
MDSLDTYKHWHIQQAHSMISWYREHICKGNCKTAGASFELIQQQIMSNRQEREEYLNKIFCLHSEQKDRCTKNETGQ